MPLKKPKQLQVKTVSPSGNQQKLYYFCVTTNKYGYPTIAFTHYEHQKKIGGKWKTIADYNNTGHPKKLKEFSLPKSIINKAHRIYLKWVSEYLIIQEGRTEHATGSLYK